MPEDDAIRRLASAMNGLFAGEDVLASSPQGCFTASARKINGRVLERIRVHDKRMFTSFAPPEVVSNEPQEWMHIHPSLYGWWRFNGDGGVVDEGCGVAHRIAPVAKGG